MKEQETNNRAFIHGPSWSAFHEMDGFHGGGVGGSHAGGLHGDRFHDVRFHDGRFHDRGFFFGGSFAYPWRSYYPDFGYYDYIQPYSSQTWYYCCDPAGYYPYVTQFNTGWETAPASWLRHDRTPARLSSAGPGEVFRHGMPVPPRLNRFIGGLTFVIDGMPEIYPLAGCADGHPVQVASVT